MRAIARVRALDQEARHPVRAIARVRALDREARHRVREIDPAPVRVLATDRTARVVAKGPPRASSTISWTCPRLEPVDLNQVSVRVTELQISYKTTARKPDSDRPIARAWETGPLPKTGLIAWTTVRTIKEIASTIEATGVTISQTIALIGSITLGSGLKIGWTGAMKFASR